MGYIYIGLTILFTVYGQLVLKWQIGPAVATLERDVGFYLGLLLNPWVISGIASAFFAMLSWMAALSRFDIGYAYPFMSLAFVCVLVGSRIFFNEPLTVYKLTGIALVMAGIVVGTRG